MNKLQAQLQEQLQAKVVEILEAKRGSLESSDDIAKEIIALVIWEADDAVCGVGDGCEDSGSYQDAVRNLADPEATEVLYKKLYNR